MKKRASRFAISSAEEAQHKYNALKSAWSDETQVGWQTVIYIAKLLEDQQRFIKKGFRRRRPFRLKIFGRTLIEWG